MKFRNLGRIIVADTFVLSQALSTSLSRSLDRKALVHTSDQLPICATSCFLNALSESPCHTVDIACICSNIRAITVDMLPCAMETSSTMDQLYTKRFADTTCGVSVRSTSRRLIISQWALFSVAFVCVCLRFVSRLPRFGSRLGWDDWIILVVLILSLLVNILCHFLLRFGVGQDVWMLEESQLVSFLKSTLSAEIIYIFGVTLVKISILLLYLRMFNFRKQAYFLMGLSTCYGATFCTATLAACKPFNYFFVRWNSEYTGTCLDIKILISASAIVNIILDGTITLLPVTQIFTLQMNIKKKLIVSFIFLAGFLVTGISIARYVVFERASFTNFTYEYVDVGVLSVAEVDVSIISASVPAIVSLIRQLAGMKSTTKSSYESPGRPSHSSRHARSGQVEKKGSRGRWQGFTDVFTTRASAATTLAPSQNRTEYSNDELELLDEKFLEGPDRGSPGPTAI